MLNSFIQTLVLYNAVEKVVLTSLGTNVFLDGLISQ
jgi:hypothetical protein